MDRDDIKASIGKNAADDYTLNLEQHRERYQSIFPELVALLQRPDIAYIVTQYHAADRAALQYQQMYRNYSQRLRWVVFLGIIASTLMITIGTLPNHNFISTRYPSLPEQLLRIAAIATIIFSAIGTVYVQLLKGQRYLEQWMKNRAIAEEERIDFFETLAKKVSNQDITLQLIVLEYFRRYQLDKQINYYNYRSEEYNQKYSRIMFVGALLAGGVIIVNGITGVLGIGFSFLASLALILQGYSALINNKESSEQYQRSALCYEKLSRQLSEIRSRMDQVRQAIHRGDHSVLLSFIKSVHTPMAAEHQQWLETMGKSNEALQELEEQLNQISKN